MRVRVVNKFKDIVTGEIRNTNDEFDCTEERYDQIESVGHFVEMIPDSGNNMDNQDNAALNENNNGESNEDSGSGTVCDIAQMSVDELRSIAKQKKVKKYSQLSQEELIEALSQMQDL